MAISDTERSTAPRVAAHVEGEQRPEAAVHVPRGQRIRLQAGIADELHGRMLREASRELERRRRLALHPDAQGLEAAQQQRGSVGRRDRPGARAELEQALVILLPPADEDSQQQVVVAAEKLRRAVEHEVRSVVEWSEVNRRRRSRVHQHPSAVLPRPREVGKRQEGIRRRLEPDEIGAGRRRSPLVELGPSEAPALEIADEEADAVVRVVGDCDGLTLTEQPSSAAAAAAIPDAKSRA